MSHTTGNVTGEPVRYVRGMRTIRIDPAHNFSSRPLCLLFVIKVITAALHHAPIETLWDINKRKQEFNEKPLCRRGGHSTGPRLVRRCCLNIFLGGWS